jgi:hypothetical protein
MAGQLQRVGSKRTLTTSAKIGVCGLKIALAFTLHPAFAQVTAAVSGTVEDASGGTLSGVTVSVKSVETGISRVTTTGENGAFRVLSLPVGPLELSGEKQGFKRTVRTGINLVVGQEAVVNLRLHLGDLKQEVTISSEAPLVNTTTGEASGFVGERSEEPSTERQELGQPDCTESGRNQLRSKEREHNHK